MHALYKRINLDIKHEDSVHHMAKSMWTFSSACETGKRRKQTAGTNLEKHLSLKHFYTASSLQTATILLTNFFFINCSGHKMSENK